MQGLLLLLCYVLFVNGNTEKVVFQAPSTATYQRTQLITEALSPDASHIGRKRMTLTLPVKSDSQASSPEWTEQLIVLENVRPRWHYEVRLCWPATMPSDIELQTLDDLAVHQYLGQQPVLLKATDAPRTLPYRYLLVKVRPNFVTPRGHAVNEATLAFELVLDPLAFGLLPKSIIPVLGWLAVALIVGTHLVLPSLHARLDEIVHGQRQKVVRIKSQ